GVRPVAVAKQFTQGSLKETGNELDLAIAGRGMFQIQLPDGTTAYTRNGSFKLDSNGTVVTSDGYPLTPQITIPADVQQISVGTDGTVSVLQPGQTNMQQVGQIQTALFVNPAGLAALGDNNYINTAASGDPIAGTPGLNGLGTIREGFVEMSNVQLVEQMTDLITGQRAYEANSKAILTSDEMLGIVNGLKK
ncbi:MAG: flagellar basal body rod protein, partial [Pseudomonadota bacterium]